VKPVNDQLQMSGMGPIFLGGPRNILMNPARTSKFAPELGADHNGSEGMSLTREEVEFFSNKGFLSLEQLTSREEVLALKTSLEDLCERRVGEKEGAQEDFLAGEKHEVEKTAPQIMNPVNYLPELRRSQCYKNALSIAKQVLGDEATCTCDLAILKKANVGSGTPWHQDEAFRDPALEYHELNVWVALQDVTVENGCLHYLPESHNNEVLEHGPPNNDPTSQALQCIGAFDKQNAVACEIPAGGCTIHHSRMLHSAGPNVSDRARLAYIMIFGTPPTPAKHPREFPWLAQRDTAAQAQRRRWMRRGGVFIAAWRKLRRADFKSWGSAVNSITRSFRNLRSNY
jgi:ectoine hydroxylase-related dioxygenase (phytanoyl-CoA dioxygenase family)